jgi:phytoene synthase
MGGAKYSIFHKGSQTYSTASFFFPPRVGDDIASLYSFVRVADDYVDNVPQDLAGYTAFKNDYFARRSKMPIVLDFKRIERIYHFDPEWASAFFRSMDMDLSRTSYATLDELSHYLYGSSEVIGLYMSSILRLPRAADHYARLLGRAMQIINFVRDIQEDIRLGRVYLPGEDLTRFGVSLVEFRSGKADKESVERLIRFEIDRYRDWYRQAAQGFSLIPRRYRVAIQTAADMYEWTASEIYRNPALIFCKKVKPSRWRIILAGIYNVFNA